MRGTFLILMSGCVFIFAADFTLTDDWHLNELMRNLELCGDVEILRGFEPYYVSDVLGAADKNPDAFWVERAERLSSPYNVKNRGFILWTPGVWGYRTNEKNWRTFGVMRFGVGGTYRKWSVCGIYRLDSGYYEDPDYYGARWERVAGKSDQVYLRWSDGDYFVQGGRDYLRLGLGMALAGRKPFEKITAGFRIGKNFKLLWFVGQLDEYVVLTDTSKTVYNRFLAGHRAELCWRHFEVGFSEFIIFGGVGRRIELYYLMPLYAFHGEQLNHRWDDNTLWSLDFKVLFPPFRLRAEGILDDFQIEHETAADREPAQYGFAVQGDFAAVNSPLFLSPFVRYELVSNRTYNQKLPWNRFLYESKPLGAEYGNDYRQFSCGADYMGSFYGGKLSFYYRQKGEGRIDDRWAEPWLDDPNWSEKFPSGVVENHIGTKFSMWADGINLDFLGISTQFSAGISGMWERVENFDHQDGKNADVWEIMAEFRTRIWSNLF
ncbi:hypothetical protein J7M00_02135 [bacterium]|nr:hypothetical protein [bacterium]